MMPGGGAAEGPTAAERIRNEVERAKPGGLAVTASLGVAAAQGSAVNFEEIFRRADAALYEAKREGRNRVVVAESPGQSPSTPSLRRRAGRLPRQALHRKRASRD